MKRLHDEHVRETSEGNTIQPFILYNDQDSEETNNSKDLNPCPNRMEDLSFEVTGKPAVESNTFVLVNSVGTSRRLEVEQKLEFLGDPHPGLNSGDFF